MSTVILKLGLLLIIFGIDSGDTKHSNGPCGKGTYLVDLVGEICVPCPTGSFMASDKHMYSKCKSCRRPNRSKNQYVKTACTPTTDASIGCLNGYQDHSQIDGDFHGSNVPDCRPNGELHTEVIVVPENRSVHTQVTAVPGNKVTNGREFAEFKATPTTNCSRRSETNLLILSLYLPLITFVSVLVT